jgi:hypothetical protein
MSAAGISILGLIIVLTFALDPPVIYEDLGFRKLLIGSIFSFICVSGAIAALFPKQCSRGLHFQKSEEKFPSQQVYFISEGHHPECREFSAHVIQVRDRTLCAACTGLLIGALLALFGAVSCFFIGCSIGKLSATSVLIGAAAIALGFFQLKFKGFIRLTLNTFFVVGAFLVLAGVDELIQSFVVDLFLTVFIVLWLLTRILLSQWDHSRICKKCKSQCGISEPEKK